MVELAVSSGLVVGSNPIGASERLNTLLVKLTVRMNGDLIGTLWHFKSRRMSDHLQLCSLEGYHHANIREGIFFIIAIDDHIDQSTREQLFHVISLSEYGLKLHWFSSQFLTWKSLHHLGGI